MTQLIIQLSDAVFDGSPFIQMKPRAPGSTAIQFDCSISDAAFATLNIAQPNDEPVKKAGSRLFTALAKHPDINQRLQAACDRQGLPVSDVHRDRLDSRGRGPAMGSPVLT